MKKHSLALSITAVIVAGLSLVYAVYSTGLSTNFNDQLAAIGDRVVSGAPSSSGSTPTYQGAPSGGAPSSGSPQGGAPGDVAPVIQGLAVPNVSATTATITWTTNVLSDTQVFYDTTNRLFTDLQWSYQTTIDSNQTTTHSVVLTGLSASTTYYFQVKSGASGLYGTRSQWFVTSPSGVAITPSIDTLTISPSPTVRGQPAIIRWTTTGIQACTLESLPNNYLWNIASSSLGLPKDANDTITIQIPSNNVNVGRSNGGISSYVQIGCYTEPFTVVNGRATEVHGTYIYKTVPIVIPSYASTTYTYTVNKTGTGTGTVTGRVVGGTQVIDCGAVCSSTSPTGTTINFTATSAQGSTFTSWTGCSSTSGDTCSLGLSNNATVTANFTASLDYTSPTVSLTAPASGATVSGTAVTISATATDDVGVAGVSFIVDNIIVGLEDRVYPYSILWDSTTVSNGTHTIKAMARDTSGNSITTAPRTITVMNLANPVTLTVSKTGSSSQGTVSGNGINCGSTCQTTVNSGTTVTLTATSSAGFMLNSWSGCTSSAGTSCTVTVTANTIVTVNFTADTISPTVSLTAPASGATASGTAVTISATAADNIAVAGVAFRVDGIMIGIEDTVSPYSVSWNTTGVTNGTHSVTATARDVAGNRATSTRSVVTSNSVTDTIKPTVPAGLMVRAVSTSSINLSWTASTDNIGVTGYKIYRNGTFFVNTSTATTFQDTGLFPNTTYSYTVAAYDATGNVSGQSTSVSTTTMPGSVQYGNVTMTLTATATHVPWGLYTFINWSSVNATSCLLSSWSDHEFGPSGGMQTGAITGTTTISMNCTGPGGYASASVTITIDPIDTTPPPDCVGLMNSIPPVTASGASPITITVFSRGRVSFFCTRDANGATTSPKYLPQATGGVSMAYFDATLSRLFLITGDGIVNGHYVTAPYTVWEYQLSGTPVPQSASFVRSVPIIDTPYAGYYTIFPLHSGGLILYWGNYIDHSIYAMYRNPQGVWANSPLVFQAAQGGVADGYQTGGGTFVTAAQHPVDNSIWMFYMHDASGAIGEARLVETSTGLTLGYNNGTVIAGSAEISGIHAVADTTRNTILLGFGGGETMWYCGVTAEHPNNFNSHAQLTLAGVSPTGTVTILGKALYQVNAYPFQSPNLLVQPDKIWIDFGAQIWPGDNDPYNQLYGSGCIVANRRHYFTIFSNGSFSTARLMNNKPLGYVSTSTDTVVPSISVTSPSAGTTVSGVMSASASAYDNVGVVGVQYYVDGVSANLEAPAPFTMLLNTHAFVNGTHALTAVARDDAGNLTTSAPVSFQVDNSATDIVPPTVFISWIADGMFDAATTTVVTLNGRVEDKRGIQNKIMSRVDGGPWATSTYTGICCIDWQLRTLGNYNFFTAPITLNSVGRTKVEVRGIDNANNFSAIIPASTVFIYRYPPGFAITLSNVDRTGVRVTTAAKTIIPGTLAYLDMGTTTAYGQSYNRTQVWPYSGFSTAYIPNLIPNTTYHLRMRYGTFQSPDMTFTTLP